jgi:hypothetical protein
LGEQSVLSGSGRGVGAEELSKLLANGEKNTLNFEGYFHEK